MGGREGRVLGRAVAVDEVDIRQGRRAPAARAGARGRRRRPAAGAAPPSGASRSSTARWKRPASARASSPGGAPAGRAEAGHGERPRRAEQPAAAVRSGPQISKVASVERRSADAGGRPRRGRTREGRLAHQAAPPRDGSPRPLGRAGRARGVDHVGQARRDGTSAPSGAGPPPRCPRRREAVLEGQARRPVGDAGERRQQAPLAAPRPPAPASASTQRQALAPDRPGSSGR